MAEEANTPPADATASRRGRRNGASEADELAGTGYEQLPEAFLIRDRDGLVETRDPCYRLQSSIYTGEVRYARLYYEGTILVHPGTPNDAMTPLNRAAALSMVRWRRSLPYGGGTPIGPEEMCEAAQELANDPPARALSKRDFNKAVMDRALELRASREGRDFRMPPLSPHNFRAGASSAPPLLGAPAHHMSNMSMGASHSRFGPPPEAPPPDPQATRAVDPA